MSQQILSTIFLVSLCFAAQADFDKGLAAYQAGDYETAFAEFERLAELDIVIAQTNLGYMYTLGEGVEKDLSKAYQWFRRAAENKSTAAQLTLGSMLYHGEGVEADPVESYAWFSVAAAGGQDAANEYVLLLTSRLNSADLNRARLISEEYYEKYAVPTNISLGAPDG